MTYNVFGGMLNLALSVYHTGEVAIAELEMTLRPLSGTNQWSMYNFLLLDYTYRPVIRRVCLALFLSYYHLFSIYYVKKNTSH